MQFAHVSKSSSFSLRTHSRSSSAGRNRLARRTRKASRFVFVRSGSLAMRSNAGPDRIVGAFVDARIKFTLVTRDPDSVYK
jgi:hypothetical protein